MESKDVEKRSGKLYLVPTPLGDCHLAGTMPPGNTYVIETVRHFVVEEIATAKRFLARCGLKHIIDESNFYLLNEHTDSSVAADYVKVMLRGSDMALMSEAGLPAVADPGSMLVAQAHIHNLKVIPLVGPSSLMMALMASGLSGQNFAFNGYLPVKPQMRKTRLKELEQLSRKHHQSQIFIETPYRNDSLFAAILESCASSTLLTIAADITSPNEFIRTKSVGEWKRAGFTIGKRPCVFVLQG
ncbi:MAG: SAM-dependent methyltransferase [Bacteroidales bacterium]|nr:SAM-dependent methyltransferase [Bacteroidales bacterium]